MRDLIPQAVADSVRDRLIAGVVLAEQHFKYSAADEDSLTGALGQSLLAPNVVYVDERTSWLWSTEYFKVRGRGANAPEKSTGADGIFQITVSGSDGKTLRTKGLPFQSKKNWRGQDASLLKQTRELMRQCGGGIVIDYTSRGYFAANAQDVVDARGKRSTVAEKGLRPLSVVLGTQFVDCSVGRVGLYYDADEERFVGADLPTAPKHVFQTLVQLGPRVLVPR
jgi:hypothetical protein